MVVAQLVEWSLATTEAVSSKSVIGKKLLKKLFTVTALKRRKQRKKRPEWPIKKLVSTRYKAELSYHVNGDRNGKARKTRYSKA